MSESKFEIVILAEVKEFINSFDMATAAKIAKAIDLLDIFGPKLNMPHSKKIDRDIYELRICGRKEIRIFYAFICGKVFLLHGFIKKSDKLPSKEIKIARNRGRDLTP